MIKPITPAQVDSHWRQNHIPDKVIGVFNDAIQANYNGIKAILYQDEVVGDVARVMNCTVQEVYDLKWLDVEDHFRGAGWGVTYDKPAYFESYRAHWIFKPLNASER